MSVPASVMCTLCGEAGTVETDIFNPASVADALWWAAHFAGAHPEVPNGVSRDLVMTPEPTNPAHADGRGICSWAEPEGREFAQCSTCQGGPVCYCTDTGFPTTPQPGDL